MVAIFIYCICIQVVELFKAIEVVVRSLLNVKSHVLGNGNSEIHASIAAKNQPLLKIWESFASSIPLAYEGYSMELLKLAVEVWVNARVHAFAKVWTMKFEKKNTLEEPENHLVIKLYIIVTIIMIH